MSLQIPVPDSVLDALRAKLGDALEDQTKTALAMEWYRAGLITSGQVGEILGMGWYEAQEFLRGHGLGHTLTTEEITADADRLKELRRR